MIGFAFFATIINYLDRQALSVVAPLLTEKFGMSNEAYGLVISAFMLAYTISNGVSGPLIDRLGTRLGYALCMAVWSTAGLLHALATGAWSLGAYRFVLGIGEAGNWPAGSKVAAEWFPDRERALACGIFNSGSAIGAIVAPTLMVWLVKAFGWQWAFVIVGLTGYAWIAGWWAVYRTPPQPRAEAAAPPAPAWRLFCTRFTSVLMLAKIFLDPVWYFYIFWFPKYLSTVHHFDLGMIARTAGVPFVAAGLGNFAGGGLTAWLLRRGLPVSRARKTAIAVFVLLMCAGMPAAFASDASVAIAWVCVATFGYTGYNANALALAPDVFPKANAASVWGLASMGAGLGGLIFNPITGSTIDRHGYTPVFIGYGVMPLIALALILLALGPLKPHPKFQAPA